MSSDAETATPTKIAEVAKPVAAASTEEATTSPIKEDPTEALTGGGKGEEDSAGAEGMDVATTDNHQQACPKPEPPVKMKEDGTKAEPIDDSRKEEASATESGGRREWDHSNRRIIIHNVFKYWDRKTVEKAVKQWIEDGNLGNLIVEKIKKPPKTGWAVLTMKEECMCQPLISYINDNDITNKKGGKLMAKFVEEQDQAHGQKRPPENNGSSFVPTKRQKLQGAAGGPSARRPVTEDEIKQSITPLWRLSEEEQRIEKTKQMINKCAVKVVAGIKGVFRKLAKDKSRKGKVNKLYSWLEGTRCIDVKEVVSAPTPLRNKSEFTFGYRYLFDNENGSTAGDTETPVDPQKVPGVGFMVTGWAGGVSRPHCCRNIPPEMCQLVDIVDEFLSTSVLVPYDTKAHTGFWRTMTVRTSRRTKECMVIIMHSPPSGGKGEEQKPDMEERDRKRFETERDRLVSVLSSAELAIPDDTPLKVTSIFFQEFDGISHPTPDHPCQHVYGKEFLLENLCNCTFQISPGAFFQVNTEGAEILYKLAIDKVREVSNVPENTLLFDVCCGTGTIGLTCLKEGAVGRVVGVDISEPAIIDAKKNAELNGFQSEEDGKEKTRFVASRAETILHKEIGKAKRENPDMKFVAIVDPARQGLHTDVLKTLRLAERISRVVYVSCNPTGSLVNDAALLCQPPTKKYRGRPFQVTSAEPVDMFPLTDHCEMVMVFDRIPDDDMPQE